MQINTRVPSVKMTKSETDRLKEAGYILGHLKRELSALDLADGETIQCLGVAEFQLERAADRYGYKEKPTVKA